jgi:hypothetical protein
MKFLVMTTVLFGAAVLLEWLRRQRAPLAPGERLARLRVLVDPPRRVSHRGGVETREPENGVATSLGDTSRLYRFKIRLDSDRRA